MTLNLTLDRDKKRSLYQQIAEQIKSQISRGYLPTGARLPTVRQLAEEVGVTRLTVHNAYNELQAEGWVESVVGRGTFVARGVRSPEIIAGIDPPTTPAGVIENMVSLSQLTGIRSLAYAYPDNSLLPVNDFWDALAALRDEGTTLMQYGSPQGNPQLRIELAGLLQERGISAMPGDILITTGATQGLALVTQALTKPGDTIMVELPTYLGFINILTSYGLRPVGIPRDEQGPRLEIMEQVIVQQRPRFCYLIPNFHNPTGRSMTPDRQQALLALAEKYGMLLIEDDIYGRLAYDEPPPPAMKARDRAGVVVYLGSLSKDLLPGVRVGYIVAPEPLRQRLPALRGTMDLFGPQTLERALAYFLHQKKFKPHLRRILPVYKERRDALVEALEECMPAQVHWTQPQGGFACWLTLPAVSRLDDLYNAALQRGVAFTPGSVFMIEPDHHTHLRLCFGNQPPEVIQESVVILSDLIRERIAHTAPVRPLSFSRVPLV